MRADAAGLGLLAAAAGGLAIAFTWQPGLASIYDDSAFYLMMAQAIVPWTSAPAAVLAAAPFDTYPPLLPLLLALGGGAYDWRVAHALVALAFAMSVFLLGIHARQVMGSRSMGFAAALVYAFMPGVWLNLKGILSEFPYMAIAFGALVVHGRGRDRPASTRRAALLGTLLAAALLMRTIGVALVVAVAAAEALRYARERDARRLRDLALCVAIPLAAAAAWMLLRPSSGNDAYAEYGARAAQAATRDGAWLVAIVASNASALVDAWLNALLIFWGDWWRPGFLLAAGLGAAGCAVLLARAWRGEADGLYCAAFVAILLLWPFPGQMYRLALPAIPLVMVGALAAAQWLLTLLRPGNAPQRAPFAALLPLALCAPAVLFYIVERYRAPDDSPAPWRRADIAEFFRVPSGPAAASNAAAQIAVFRDFERIRATTPEDARVMWYVPAYVALLARRHGAPLERPAGPTDLADQVRRTRSDYIYLANLHPRDSAHRLGHPLDPAAHARGFARVAWHRSSAAGELQAVLLEIDREKITNSRAP